MKRLRQTLLLFHTVRYLRPVQLYGRLWRRLYQPNPRTRPAPPVCPVSQPFLQPLALPPSLLGPQQFTFLNREGAVEQSGDWNATERDKLWLYNLHYFDDLNAAQANQRTVWHRALIARWIADNSPGQGNGWEPYPTSLRIVNWLKWALYGNALEAQWVQSLAVQTRWLRKHLEWHLLGNHLFANAKALVFAGALFSGPEADEWFARGLAILEREVPEQILMDGGHFERSPMYHAIILGDLLDLLNMARVYPGLFSERLLAQWRAVVQRMRRWMASMIHPDGGVSFFNDAALGIAPEYSALEAYAERLALPENDPVTEGATQLSDSGYIRLARGGAVAILDVAPVGPDYLPGHAHADTLSFELSLSGRRVLVNSGVSQYGLGPERLRQRSTAAHNTVTIDGQDSSEVWGGFRVARRAYPFGLTCEESEGLLSVSCAHDGYRRLPGRPVHQRKWLLTDSGLTVIDNITGDCGEAIARYFLHPQVEPVTTESLQEGELRLQSSSTVRWKAKGGEARIVPSSFHPEFGLSLPGHCIEVTFTDASCEMAFLWEPQV